MKTFTTYAEKKAKQFFNLLQGYTKGIRITAILILLLMGVNNAWAASEGSSWYDWASSENVYFDNTNSSYSNVSMLIGRQWNYSSDAIGSSGVNFTKISNTNNLYHAATTWNHYNTLLFMDAKDWGWEGNKVTQRYTYANNYTNTNNVDINGTELFYAASSTKGATLNHQDLTSYTALNYTQTVQQYLSTDGGSNYSASTTALATVKVSSYQLNTKNTTTSSSGTIASGSSSATCSAARTATVTYTVTDVKSGYTFVGWYDGTTQKSTDTTYTYNATAAKIITARFKANTYTVTVTNDGHGTTDPSGAQSNVGQVTGLDIEADPATNYEFVNWTITSGSGSFGSETSASTTFKPTSAATIQANFRSTATDILTVAAGAGIASVTGSEDPVTLGNTYPITATPKTGYTFSTWTANPAANAEFADARSENTTVTVNNGSVIVTATATEDLHAITVQSSDDNHGTVTISADKAGIATFITITATPEEGYRFVNWTTETAGITIANATDASTTVTATAAGTITANFEEIPKETIYFVNKDNWSKVNVYRWDGSAASDSWPGIEATKADFRLHCCDVYYVSALPGSYEKCIFNNGSDSQTADLTWTAGKYFYDNAWKTLAELTYDVKLAGTMYNNWDGVAMTVDANNTNSITVSLEANTTYEFKIVVDNNWHGNTGTMTYGSSTGWTMSSSEDTNCKIKTAGAGNYIFTYDVCTAKLTVTYPTSYTVTYSRTPTAAADAPTTDLSITSGNYVAADTRVTFTAKTAKTGYTFKGWYDNNKGTGDALSTNLAYTCTINVNTTVYACYDLITYDITYNLNGGDGATNTTYNVESATITLPTDLTKTGYTFAGWFDNEELTGDAVTQITKGTTGDKTFHAKWTATEYTITYNDLHGVTHSNPETYTIETETITFAAPTSTRTGYTFAGWDPTEIEKGSTGNQTVTAQWTINNYNITYTQPTNGSYTIKVGNGAAVTTNTTADYNTTITLENNPATGYHFSQWNIEPNVSITNNTFSMPADDVTIGVTFAENTYKVKFDANGGTGTMSDLPFTYDIAQNLTANVFERTGYNFSGWNTNADGTGTTYTDGQSVQNLTPENEGIVTLYAKWTAKTYTVTLDQTEAKVEVEGTTSVLATYNADMPSATMPTAANGYVLFMGYFDGEQGAGTQYYNADGTSAHVWDKAEDATLYAHFAKAEITQITLDQYTFKPVEAGGTGFVTATPTIEPTPTNDVVLCWRLLYNNDNPVAGRDAQVVSGNSVQFSIAGLAAGTYKIEAVLRTGNNCGSGEVLSTKTVNFSIASSYTITVRYTCDGKEIAAPAKVSASVTEETEITAPNITGYTLSSWEAGDGVTIESTNGNSVKITAIYDGYLTAKYTARPMVYFKNTLGWEKVYVYTFWENAWWNDNGTGVHPATNQLEQGEMTRIGETDIYYFALTNPDGDYTQNNNANPNYIAFSNVDYRNDNGAFRSGQAIYRGDHKEKLTLFVPQIDQTPETHNSTKYYSKGIWMEYNSTESGYQLAGEVPNDDPEHDGWGTYGNKFTAQQPGNYIFTITKHLEANKTYKFKIKNAVWIKDYNNTDNNQWFGYDGTINNSTTSSIHFKGDNDEGKNNGDAQIKTTAEGEYTFTIDLSQGKVLLSVEYPVQVGDYRVIYKDNATWSKGTAHDANWYHPSRIIKKNKTAEPTKDIISFFISYGQNTTMQFQRVKSITNGNVTWENAGEARIPDAVKEAGVYNFIVTQEANGASISMEDNAEPYTGNYYIRVDALAGKWDNYKTNPENRMTYSAFSESEANSFGEKFSHYATKYCTNGTNIKFTIANDYSPCISDTLVQDVVNPLGNLDSEGTLLSNDMYNANVRFMWYRKTNKISRAYVGPAGDKQSQFLMLRTNVEMQDAAGALDAAEGDIIDAGNSIYAARFADTQNWIYERTVKVKPGTRVKLYASYPKCYHIYVENNTGWSDIALYAWKDGGDQPLGAWPGLRPARTVEIGGTTYHDFQVNEWFFGSKLKLNNNNNGKETDEFNGIGTAGNYYLTATSSALTTVKYEANVTEANAQYFRGAYDDNNSTWNDNNSVVILGGSGDNWNKIRIIYDFKTNRLMAALVPDQEVSGEKTIAADVMIIRQHQNPATSITLANDASKMTQVKTVYGSLQLNRWVLNNRKSDKSGIEYCTEKINNQDTYSENVTNTHHPVLPTGEQKSIYERALYFISFPFDVHLSDVFGFGTYGTHWVISDYNGLRRAQRGYFAEDCINEDCTNWDYIWDPADFILEANKGYLLSLDLDLMRYDNTDFWLHNIDQVELYFPSTANLATIEKISYTMPALSEEYLCKINHNTDGTTPDRDRRVKDSYWRCIGVPSFANYDGSLYKSKEDAEANEGEGKYPINWKDDYTWTADESGFPFLYEWNVTDNSLSVQNTSAYQFKPTFAYLVQNGDAIYWKAVNTKPSTSIIARQRTEADRNYEWKIALLRNGNQEDQTFVRITDNENVTTAFDFNQDLAKEFNYGRGDIYTLIGYERVAANSMPCSDKTTIIPLGLNIEQAGDYTIAMPEGVENIGITLVDNETGIHTNLSAGQEYTLTLNNGICENRLFIEVSPIQNTPTDLEYTTGDTREQSVRKVLIDGKLYIVCDGVVYDAQGKRM